jgi:hypothetical protein
MVFAYAAMSAAQKPRHPFGAGALYIRILGLLSAPSAAKSAVTPYSGRAQRLGGFSPAGEGLGGSGVAPQKAPYSPQHPVSGLRAASVPCRRHPCRLSLPSVGGDFGKKSSPFCPSGRGIVHSHIGAFIGSLSAAKSVVAPYSGRANGWVVFPPPKMARETLRVLSE